jgi:hypothetical protein
MKQSTKNAIILTIIVIIALLGDSIFTPDIIPK